MIIDSFDNAAKYYTVHKLFAKAFKFILDRKTAGLPEGRYEIQGNDLFAMVSHPSGRPRKDAILERHKKYIDIQVSYDDTDVIGWKALKYCVKPAGHYDPAKDMGFYDDEPDEWFRLRRGYFCVFFPEDAHAPLAVKGKIHKVVVKVAANIR